jgi:ferric-dicitrate binding protein FerR (iron transport regulator)
MNVRNEQIDRYLDGQMEADEIQALLDWVGQAPEHAERFARQCLVHEQLGELMAGGMEAATDDPVRITASPVNSGPRHSVEPARRPATVVPYLKTMFLIATSLILLLSVGLYFQWSSPQRTVARVTGISGSLLWTGDGGRVVGDLAVGTELSGGTIEGTGPHSWAELEFNDGSKFMVFGSSMLTFSDHGQKELRLREGSFSATVVPQPVGKPMLVHTRSVTLEVVGTQFEVETELALTALDVNEGMVRVKRLSDGAEVDVPANHHVTATAEGDMSPTRIADTVHQWKSLLNSAPEGMYGKWSPPMPNAAASLRSIPYITEQGKSIYAAAIQVSLKNRQHVALQADSLIRVRGRIDSPHAVFFGMTLKHPNGDFAGRFQTIRPADQFRSDQEFEVELPLADYQLDPSLNHMRSTLPTELNNLIVESVWCHTLYSPAGLTISEVSLISADHQ